MIQMIRISSHFFTFLHISSHFFTCFTCHAVHGNPSKARSPIACGLVLDLSKVEPALRARGQV